MTIPVLLNIWPHGWAAFPLFLKICFIVSIVAIIGIVIALSDIYIWRKAKKRKEEKNAELSNTISRLLMNAVVTDTGTEKNNPTGLNIQAFRDLGLSDKEVRCILVTEMINYRSYFSGSIAARVRTLYLVLSLDKYAKESLMEKDWETKVHALSELFKMDVEPDTDYLLSLLHDKNRYIRDFARLCLMKFTKGDPLDFIRMVSEPVSQWEDFEILTLLQHRKNFRVSSLEGLIDPNRERSVVSLSLKIAVAFRHLSSVPLIIRLLRTEDIKLRAEAVAALGKMETTDAAAHLAKIYAEQPNEIKLEILTALGKIKNETHLDFLEHTFITSEDFEIKKRASDAITKLYPVSKHVINRLINNTEALNHRILSHSLNPLINAL